MKIIYSILYINTLVLLCTQTNVEMNNIHITCIEVYYFNIYVVTISKSKTVKSSRCHPIYIQITGFRAENYTYTRSFYTRILLLPIIVSCNIIIILYLNIIDVHTLHNSNIITLSQQQYFVRVSTRSFRPFRYRYTI